MPDIYDRLRELADRQGLPAAVLASVAIGQYVSTHMAGVDASREMQDKIIAIVERMPQQLLELERGGQL